MAKVEDAGTRADELYEQLHAQIFTGRLAPGARLKFPDLCAQYETSVGVVREALTRLAGERLVNVQAHLGYTVASLSVSELTDLTTARVEIEGLTFRSAILSGDAQWESDVVAANHLLHLRERQASGGARGDDWYVAHEAFHAILLAGCGNRRLVEIARTLRAEAEVYRRWGAALIEETGRDPGAEHQALAEAVIKRDSVRGFDLLRQHIVYTTQMLVRWLAQADRPAQDARS